MRKIQFFDLTICGVCSFCIWLYLFYWCTYSCYSESKCFLAAYIFLYCLVFVEFHFLGVV